MHRQIHITWSNFDNFHISRNIYGFGRCMVNILVHVAYTINVSILKLVSIINIWENFRQTRVHFYLICYVNHIKYVKYNNLKQTALDWIRNKRLFYFLIVHEKRNTQFMSVYIYMFIICIILLRNILSFSVLESHIPKFRQRFVYMYY